MININDVKNVLCTLTGFDVEELENYSAIIQNSVCVIENTLKDSSAESDSRVVYLAAARANYNIALIVENDGVSTFKAGDVSISKSKDSLERAKAVLENAKDACASLISDNGFVFKGV